jgi:hypothetical protein
MFKAVCKLGLEGIVSKKIDAPYKSGTVKGVAECGGETDNADSRPCLHQISAALR